MAGDANNAVQAEQITQLKNSDKDQWDHITGLEKALTKLIPVWTTVVLTLAGFITGSALTFAGLVIRFADKLFAR